MSKLFTKENMARLTADERARLMQLQMSPAYGSRSGYLPDDCSECGVCGCPTRGGWCDRCYEDWDNLTAKAQRSEPVS